MERKRIKPSNQQGLSVSALMPDLPSEVHKVEDEVERLSGAAAPWFESPPEVGDALITNLEIIEALVNQAKKTFQAASIDFYIKSNAARKYVSIAKDQT